MERHPAENDPAEDADAAPGNPTGAAGAGPWTALLLGIGVLLLLCAALTLAAASQGAG